MAVNLTTLGTRQIENALRRGAKTALVTGGIQPSTRRGNKELDLAVQRLAQQTYSSLEEAAKTGESLGQKIVELSQAKGKTDLDGGIVRQMMITGEIPTVVKVTAKPAQTAPVVVAPASKLTADAKAEAIATAVVADEAQAVGGDTHATAGDAEIIADAVEVVPDEADGMADEANVVAAEAMAAETIETVDSEMADAPDLAAIATLEPADIDAPEPEPLTAATTGTVEELAESIETEPEAVGKAK